MLRLPLAELDRGDHADHLSTLFVPALALEANRRSWSGFRGIVHLVGPDHDPAAWPAILVPLEFGRELVRTVLHVALLAAAVGVAAEVSDETAAPEMEPAVA